MTDRDEDSLECEWPAAPDPLRSAAVPLIEIIFTMTAEGRQREQAVSAMMETVEKVRMILNAPRLN